MLITSPLYTRCHYCETVATGAGNKVSWRWLEELQVKDEDEIQHLGMHKYIPLISCISNLFTSWHFLLKSWSILHGYLLRTYRCGIRILYGMESGWCRLYTACKPFSGAQLLELRYRVLETLLYLLLTRFIWSSHVDLSGSGPHKLIALSLIH